MSFERIQTSIHFFANQYHLSSTSAIIIDLSVLEFSSSFHILALRRSTVAASILVILLVGQNGISLYVVLF